MPEDLDLDLDLRWARDLFDRTRGAGEPAWTADAAVLARAGDRRRRFRTASAGAGLAGVVAVTAVVALGLGAGTTDAGSQPGPGGGWGNRPLADVFEHVHYLGRVDGSRHAYVPRPAVGDLASVLGRLDPSLTHLVGKADDVSVVSAGDSRVEPQGPIAMTTVWTTDAPRSAGQLAFEFVSSIGPGHAMLGGLVPGADQLTGPCAGVIGVGQGTKGTANLTAVSVRWSACSESRLPDGSTTGSASARVGAGTEIVAVRQFADGEGIAVIAQDYTSSGWQTAPPDPATVVHPSPWTEQSLVAALADPAVGSGWRSNAPDVIRP